MNIRNVKQLGARITNGAKGKGQVTVDASAIRELAELIAETGLTEIEIESSGQRLRVVRQLAPVVERHGTGAVMVEPVRQDGAAAEVQAKREVRAGHAVTSPMVGTVYVAPEPGKPAFVKVGDTVKEGDTLLIVEAMKTMNPILAPRSGTVSEICIADSEPVEFGQALLYLS